MAEVDEDDEMAGVRSPASEPARAGTTLDERFTFDIIDADGVLKLKKRHEGLTAMTC